MRRIIRDAIAAWQRMVATATQRSRFASPVIPATNALDAGAANAKVQEWLGHAIVTTTPVYDHRCTRPNDSPTFKVKTDLPL
jgi:integrase/recombinase XerD